MSVEVKGVPKFTFELKGSVGYLDTSGTDSDVWCGARLDEEIEASSLEEAIGKAKVRIAAFLAKNKQYAPDPADLSPKNDWDSDVKEYGFTLTQVMWTMKYRVPKAGRPAIPAVPPVEAGVEETLHV